MSTQSGLIPPKEMSNEDLMNEAIAKLNDQLKERRKGKKHGKTYRPIL
jgi:hypothetical protein